MRQSKISLNSQLYCSCYVDRFEQETKRRDASQDSLRFPFVQHLKFARIDALTEDRLIYFSNKQNSIMQSAIKLRIIGAGLVALRASSTDLSIKSCRRAFNAIIGNGVLSD